MNIGPEVDANTLRMTTKDNFEADANSSIDVKKNLEVSKSLWLKVE